MKEIQKKTDRWIKKNTKGYWRPMSIMLRAAEETGELAREINCRFGDKPRKSGEDGREIGQEIADIIFTLTCLANSLKIDLDKEFNKMLRKYTVRDKGRHKR